MGMKLQWSRLPPFQEVFFELFAMSCDGNLIVCMVDHICHSYLIPAPYDTRDCEGRTASTLAASYPLHSGPSARIANGYYYYYYYY